MKEVLKALLIAAATALGAAMVNEAVIAYKAREKPKKRGKK